jgi:hypothetical protein
MNVSVPVLSPVASYEAIGGSAWSTRWTASNSLHAREVGHSPASGAHSSRSHDLPPSPTSACRGRSLRIAILLPLLAGVTACATNDAVASHFLVVKLPASIVLLLLAGLGCGLAGFGLGLAIALQFLRTANRASSEYHRSQIARVLGASSSVHASVQEVLSIVHRRTQELQRLVAMLQKGGAR